MAQLREQVPEADPLLRVEPGGGLVHDQQLGVGEHDAQPLPHPAREAAEGAVGRRVQVDALEEALDLRAAPHALEPRDLVEELVGG